MIEFPGPLFWQSKSAERVGRSCSGYGPPPQVRLVAETQWVWRPLTERLRRPTTAGWWKSRRDVYLVLAKERLWLTWNRGREVAKASAAAGICRRFCPGSFGSDGGLWAFRDGDFANPYYHIAREKPSPLAEEFSLHYFQSLARGAGKVSAKAFLATEQRVPGLGNGVLQDILYNARIHPKRKLDTLSEAEYEGLYKSVRATLRQMAEQGGRDTEKDLYGQAGGYPTIMSKKNIANPCPSCGGTIKKEAYLGGSVYYCPSCQGL